MMKVQCPECKTDSEVSDSNLSDNKSLIVCPNCQATFNYEPVLPTSKDTSINFYASQPGKMNPWFSMWTKPRATIQHIVDTDPERFVLLLAAAYGFSNALDRASMRNMGDKMGWPLIVVIAAVFGAIGGIISLYIGGALIRWTGKWIGGRASSQNIRAAMAWSSVPILWSLILWIPELALFGQDLFTAEMPRIEADPYLALFFLGFGAIEIMIAIWTFVIFLKSLGQVQGFSAWKALGNAILAFLIIVVPLAVIIFGIASLTGL